VKLSSQHEDLIVVRKDGEVELVLRTDGDNWSQETEAIKDAVVADVEEFIGEGEIYDDITLVALKQS
jgi:serine phosphatase RsbU (regulator of sigma subunit)